MLRHARMAHRVAAHMRLVDDRALPRRLRLAFLAPGEGRIDDAALWDIARAVALVERKVGVGGAHRITEERLVPFDAADELAGVWIDQKLVRVEAVAVLRVVRPGDGITLDRARPRIRQVTVPDLVRILVQGDTFDLRRAVDVEDAKFHLRRIG